MSSVIFNPRFVSHDSLLTMLKELDREKFGGVIKIVDSNVTNNDIKSALDESERTFFSKGEGSVISLDKGNGYANYYLTNKQKLRKKPKKREKKTVYTKLSIDNYQVLGDFVDNYQKLYRSGHLNRNWLKSEREKKLGEIAV